MAATAANLFARFKELGIETTTIEHPPLNTVEESQNLRGDLPGGHCKNLLLRDKKKRNWLIVTLEDKAVDLKSLPDKIGAGRLSFASADRLWEYLAVKPGSVTPFALINDPEQKVQVVLDEDMLAHDLLNYHPLENTATTAIKRDDLLKFINACGHLAMTVKI
jgi:Ala-tRNA(Pro) deacylase